MAKPKFDGVIEAVHYDMDGQVVWVRVFERRGPTFSDRVLLNRESLIQQIKAGKRFFSGKRKEYLAGTFEISELVKVIQKNGKDILAIGDQQTEQDCLKGVPII